MRVHAHHPKSLWLKILPITPYYSRILMLSPLQLHCFHRPGGEGVPLMTAFTNPFTITAKASDKTGWDDSGADAHVKSLRRVRP